MKQPFSPQTTHLCSAGARMKTFPTFGVSINIDAMKYFFVLPILMLLLAGSVQAQNTPAQTADDAVARTATDVLVKKYTLNADQAKQMYTVQVRKQRNLSQIESLKTTNPAKFRSKLQGVQQGTLSNIRGVLNTKAQVDLYKSTQGKVRLLQADKRKELMVKKSSKEEIDAALLEIYAE
jgi:hypothetical protein